MASWTTKNTDPDCLSFEAHVHLSVECCATEVELTNVVYLLTYLPVFSLCFDDLRGRYKAFITLILHIF